MTQLKAYKTELRSRNNQGFTLMEMLIVIAIIAVLVAIAIPVFTAQLSNARAQTDAANIRSGYAAATTEVLTDSDVTEGTYWGLNSDASVEKVEQGTYTCQGNASDLSNTSETIGGQSATEIGWKKGNYIKYTYQDEAITISAAESSTDGTTNSSSSE